MRNTQLVKFSNQVRLCFDPRWIKSTSGSGMFSSHRMLNTSNVSSQIKEQPQTTLNVFDRKTKKLQRERAALSEDLEVFDYLKEEVGYRLADRIFDVKRKFKKVLNLGCSRGYVSKHVLSDNVEELILADNSEELMLHAGCDDSSVKIQKVVCDEEHILDAFKTDTIDLVISNLGLHWVNDLPSCFEQVMKILKSDGIFLGSVFGGETLYELRSSLQLAELERNGGISPHISPFTRPRDIGGLLTRAGFVMQTIDTDEIVINYPTMFELISDLKGMGESNASWNRSLHLSRDTLIAASVIYKQLYGNELKAEKNDEGNDVGDGGIPATYQIIYFIGWKPDPSQPKPLERGSAQVSLKDLYNLGDVVREGGSKIPVDEK